MTREEVRARIETQETRQPINEFAGKHTKYAVPLEELRAQLDRELGNRSFTSELDGMREGTLDN